MTVARLGPVAPARRSRYLVESMSAPHDPAEIPDTDEHTIDSGAEGAWLDEITRRLDAHERGETAPIPAQAVFAEARERMKRARG